MAQDNADQVAVIDTTGNAVTAKIDARAPAGLLSDADGRGDDDDDDGFGGGDERPKVPHRPPRYTGAATFTVTVSPDGTTLYAVNAGANSVAVIPLRGDHAYQVAGLIPTAYEPHDITFSADGASMYIVNGKSVTGPNPGHLASNTAAITSYHLSLGQCRSVRRRESVEPVPVPAGAGFAGSAPGADARGNCERLTERVAEEQFLLQVSPRRRRDG